MTNKYSTTESSKLKQEQDFVRDGVLQYDLQNNPSLVRKVRIYFLSGDKRYVDGNFFEINFPMVGAYIVDTGLADLYIECRVTNDDNTNDFIKLRLNDTINFRRKISKLFVKTPQYTVQDLIDTNTDASDYWVDVLLFADADFKSGRVITESIQPDNGQNIRWPYEPYILLLPAGPFPTQGDPQAAGTKVPLCFSNPLRKCINIYINQDCKLYVKNEDGDYETTTDPRYMYLKAGHHVLKNGSILTLEVLTNGTIIYCSEEY